ncbi:MAG: repressor LexA [Dehalococcoidia bacterium]|nr:repressor LexA [Dehalococcoidia bacterium]
MPKQIDTRARILNFIREFIRENGYPPTVREIQSAFGLASPRAVQYHLEALEGEGLIERVSHTVRGIHLPGRETVQDVPLFGTISAGQPIPVPDSGGPMTIPEEILQVPGRLVRGRKEPFALRVKGKSMIDAFVDDGDIVILETPGSVDNGDMVAVWLSDRQEVTLKKIYAEPGQVRLQPANHEMQPIYVDPDDVLVQGKVIAVLREYTTGSYGPK